MPALLERQQLQRNIDTSRTHSDNRFSNETIVDWVRDAQAGSSEAFQRLVEVYQGSVQSHACRKLGNWEEAVDLSQDVFLQAFRRLSQLNAPEAFGGWLKTMTARMCINRLTRRKRPIAMEQESLEAACTVDVDPLRKVIDGEVREQLHDGLRRLNSLDRQTLEAFYLRGQSLIEMADAFAAPVGTIKRRLHTARKRLAGFVEHLQAV